MKIRTCFIIVLVFPALVLPAFASTDRVGAQPQLTASAELAGTPTTAPRKAALSAEELARYQQKDKEYQATAKKQAAGATMDTTTIVIIAVVAVIVVVAVASGGGGGGGGSGY